MSNTIFCLSGMSSSGKTRVAKHLLKQHKHSIRISKSELRTLLHNGLLWDVEREKYVLQVFSTIVNTAIKDGKDIIFDDLNLDKVHIEWYKHLAQKHGYRFVPINLRPQLSQCLEKELEQKDSIGLDNLVNQAFRYNLTKTEDKSVVCVLDGTLSNITERAKLATTKTGGIDFEVMYDQKLLELDAINQKVADELEVYRNSNVEIIIISPRPIICRKATMIWLLKNQIPYDRLVLNETDVTDDKDVFQYILDLYIDKKACIRAIDNSSYTASLWEQNSICLQTI